jgi:hypothetical protein
MTEHTPSLSRRTVLRTATGTALTTLAGCLTDSSNGGDEDRDTLASGSPLQRIAVEGTTLVVEIGSNAALDQVSLIQPNGELFGQRTVLSDVEQVSFDLGIAYDPGEYHVVGLDDGEESVKHSMTIEPTLEIREVGLYRNHPDKPWNEVYGESGTNLIINGEAFVTIENTGTGPNTVTKLIFSGDVPNPIEKPRNGGLYEADRVIVPPGESVDLFSNSFPFGSASEEGMGCAVDGNQGQFTVTIETTVNNKQVASSFDVEYTGATEMGECEITISEAK